MTKKKNPSKPKAKMGRPTIFTQELGDKICEVTATHPWGLKRLCAHYDWMPDPTTINLWRWKLNNFSTQYTKAKMAQAELLAEDAIDIADDTSQDITYNKSGDEICNTEFVNRARLRVDTRKWVAAKLAPKIYGDAVKDNDAEKQRLKEEVTEIIQEINSKHQKDY